MVNSHNNNNGNDNGNNVNGDRSSISMITNFNNIIAKNNCNFRTKTKRNLNNSKQ